jgi:hypothetical protein
VDFIDKSRFLVDADTCLNWGFSLFNLIDLVYSFVIYNHVKLGNQDDGAIIC